MISVFISKCHKNIFMYWQPSIRIDLKILDDKYTGMKMTNMKSKENRRFITHISCKDPACCINDSASAKYRHKVTNILNTHTQAFSAKKFTVIHPCIVYYSSYLQRKWRKNNCFWMPCCIHSEH